MKPMSRSLLTVGLVILGVIFYEMTRPIGQPPGILAPNPPTVMPAGDKAPTFERDGHVLAGLAKFEAQARIVSVERYSRDPQAKLSPRDFVLGWGPLSDITTFKGVDVAQTDRTVVFESYDPKLPKDTVASYLVNLHVIGADAKLDEQIRDSRRGSIVRISGWLVEVKSGEGWRWKGTPRSAPPTMPGSVLWVQSLETIEAVAPTALPSK